MFWKVEATLNFKEQDEASDFYNDCLKAYGKSDTINPNNPNEEAGHIILHACYHDKTPTIPCEVLEEMPAPLPFNSI